MSQSVEFDRRIRRVERVQQRIRRNGRRYVMTRDGLVIAKPRRALPRFPFTGLMMVAVALTTFKAFLYLNLGQQTYLERVAGLAETGLVGKVGAWVMQPDIVTLSLADALARVF